jgi:hypothetical protein
MSDVKACSVQGIYKTADVLAHDPDSLSCANPINVISTLASPAQEPVTDIYAVEEIVRCPIPTDEVTRLKAGVGSTNGKPKAIILGHGLWSDLDLQRTVNWLDSVLGVIEGTTGTAWHGLFVTPNAAGKDKPDDWIVSQGNKALMLFEEAVSVEAAKREIEHLGTWNMSIQSNRYDGVHLDMKGNLVKAMMVMNWLSLIEN